MCLLLQWEHNSCDFHHPKSISLFVGVHHISMNKLLRCYFKVKQNTSPYSVTTRLRNKLQLPARQRPRDPRPPVWPSNTLQQVQTAAFPSRLRAQSLLNNTTPPLSAAVWSGPSLPSITNKPLIILPAKQHKALQACNCRASGPHNTWERAKWGQTGG